VSGTDKSLEAAQEVPFASNALRLSARQWAIALPLTAALLVLIPWAWGRVEAFQPQDDYRVPYALSEDYWHFARYSRLAAEEDAILVLGDSVIWGEYVPPEGTLTHHLNGAGAGRRYRNLGINGIHPAAMAGLIAYHGRAIRNRDVVMHYNPLWMSSARHDLQTEKEFRFNHPKLVPQFLRKIPCYKDPYSERFGIVAERYLPMRTWANHLAIAYFDHADIQSWTLQNPYGNPLKNVGIDPSIPGPTRHREETPWLERGMAPQAFAWVGAGTSLQWQSFQDAVDTLLARGNRLFVLAGPFNEHMIKDESLAEYDAIKASVDAWLRRRGVPHVVAQILPSELYADASHPLRAGYALLARRLLADAAFQEFLAP